MQIGPHARPGQRIGLLGGSFDPAHQGHVHITRWALRQFRLDAVWWLVSPGNPLKVRGPAVMDQRLAACRAIIPAQRVEVTDIESRLGTRFTADTLASLQRIYPTVRFTWLMGADNLASFHHWQNWRWIMQNFPVGVMARPGLQVRAGLSPTASSFRAFRLPRHDAGLLSYLQAPAWVMLTGPMSDLSSSAIRAQGEWP
jgi:nicotinate-nucleotide adenylyltransferase